MRRALSKYSILMILAPIVALASQGSADPASVPAIKAFLSDGFGARHRDAPAQIDQFGRLVGLWNAEIEIARQSGGWAQSAPGIWAWKFAIGGFAVSDLWFQGADRLPTYMSGLGRDYMLTSNRIFDLASNKWQVSWMANGAGKAAGADFGSFTATSHGKDIVMESPPDDFGLQRVVFYEIEADSFRWRSEFSQDGGKTWRTIMRMVAKRYERQTP